MALTFTIYITDEGIRATRETQQNPGWYIIPYQFRVSDTNRGVDATRTYNSMDPNPWYSGAFSTLSASGTENKIIHSVVIPPVLTTATVEKNYGEIYFIYKNHNDEEILFAIGAPSEELVYTPGISQKFYFSFSLNNVQVKDTIVVQNTDPQDIDDHNIDPLAHLYKANVGLDNLTDEGKARIAVKEYLSTETYKENDVVLAVISGKVRLFKSLINDNIDYSLLDDTKWEEVRLGGLYNSRNEEKLNYWVGTRSQYDAIVSKDINTIYNITDDSDTVLPLLNLLYPVGSLYIASGSLEACPLTVLGVGTWTLLSTTTLVTNINTSASVKGNGMTLGLTDGTNNYGLALASNSGSNYRIGWPDLYGTAIGTSSSASSTTTAEISKGASVTTDGTKSGIIADLSNISSSITVTIWERIA